MLHNFYLPVWKKLGFDDNLGTLPYIVSFWIQYCTVHTVALLYCNICKDDRTTGRRSSSKALAGHESSGSTLQYKILCIVKY